MSVFVVGLNGCRLMPVSERKARLLLKGGKASVYRKVPFTIKLNYRPAAPYSPDILGSIPGRSTSEFPLCKRTVLSYIRKRSGSGIPCPNGSCWSQGLPQGEGDGIGRPGTGTRSGSQRQSVSTMRRQTGKDGTGRNRRTRSLPKDRQGGCRHPCSPKRTIISSGSGNSWTFSRKDTGFPSNWAVLTQPG